MPLRTGPESEHLPRQTGPTPRPWLWRGGSGLGCETPEECWQKTDISVYHIIYRINSTPHNEFDRVTLEVTV